MKKALIIINEQHSLMEDQKRVLQERYDEIEFVKIPASGLTLQEQKDLAKELDLKVGDKLRYPQNPADIVFVSPIPVLLRELSIRSLAGDMEGYTVPRYRVLVFHNDRREKKELPNGKVVSVVAKEGWELV